MQVEAAVGRLRCLAALAEWDRLSQLARQEWHRVDAQVTVNYPDVKVLAPCWSLDILPSLLRYVIDHIYNLGLRCLKTVMFDNVFKLYCHG